MKSLKIEKSNVFALRDYTINRMAQTCIKTLCMLLHTLEKIENRSLCQEAAKSQTMARLYVTASILEIEKMGLAQHQFIMRQ